MPPVDGARASDAAAPDIGPGPLVSPAACSFASPSDAPGFAWVVFDTGKLAIGAGRAGSEAAPASSPLRILSTSAPAISIVKGVLPSLFTRSTRALYLRSTRATPHALRLDAQCRAEFALLSCAHAETSALACSNSSATCSNKHRPACQRTSPYTSAQGKGSRGAAPAMVQRVTRCGVCWSRAAHLH